MKIHPNEMLLLYDGSTSTGRQTRAIAYTITKHVNEFQYDQVKITSTIWRNVLDLLQLRPKDLLNRAHPEYQDKIAGKNLDDEGWLNVLIQSPHLIKAPIAIKNNKAILCLTPTEILKLS
jgi:arsenate reductase (glutaredoxin)